MDRPYVSKDARPFWNIIPLVYIVFSRTMRESFNREVRAVRNGSNTTTY